MSDKKTGVYDKEFVERLLATDYRTHLSDEIPYPDLEQLIARTDFDFPTGKVADQRDNGAYNRDEVSYQCFPDSGKRILVHRFIVAVALQKWPPRDLHIHHVNSKPDDNRPTNLELVTQRQNNAVRRAPLKEIADLTRANKWVSEIAKVEKPKRGRKGSEELNTDNPRKPSILKPDAPLEAFARVPDESHAPSQSEVSSRFPKLDPDFGYVPLDEYSPLPDGRKVPPLEDVLRKYYTIPDDVEWTGRRKGVNGCYWEATNGIWYYRKPDC